MFDQLDEYFRRKNFPIGEVIREQELLPNGKKRNTSLTLMVEALEATNNSSYYASIYPLLYSYWGWEKPYKKIQEMGIKEAIFERFYYTQQIYEANKTRDSCMNSNIRLYLLLENFCLVRDLWKSRRR